MNDPRYAKAYSEKSFLRKITRFAIVAGKEVIEKALTLYEALKDKDTPAWAKGVILASLGYFISPVDAIPDIVPVVGYADDLGALAAAIAAVAAHIKREHVATARGRLEQWFGKTGAAEQKN